jgi:Sec-independent protein translocase protein TatA
MDSFFGIGAPELVVILLLAGIVLGPKRIRQVAFWLGKVTAQLQAISRGFTRQLNAELSAIDNDGEMKGALEEVQDLRRQLADLRREITSVASEPLAEGQKAVHEAKNAVDNTIRPTHMNSEEYSIKKKASESQEPSENGESTDLPNIVEVNDDPE